MVINVQCTTVAIKSLRPLNLFAAKFSHLLSSQLNLEACPSHFSQLSHYHSSHLVTFSFSPNFVSFHTGCWADCCYSQLLVSPLLELPQRTEAEAKRAQMGRGRRGEEDGAPVCKDT